MGVESVENRGKAENFSQFYRSVYTNDIRFIRPSADNRPTASITHKIFSEFLIQRKVKELKESKSPGLDELPRKLPKDLANKISAPLSGLFQNSFDWKLEHIKPLYKSGRRVSVTTYRPISLTCILGKVMERIIKSELVKFLETHNFLSNCQNWFRKGRGCNMLEKPGDHGQIKIRTALKKQLLGDLLQKFLIMKVLDCCLEFSDFFEFADTTHLKVHPLKLRVQQVRLDVRKFSFSARVIKPWNALPEDVVMSLSLQRFKRNLDSFINQNEPEP
ncbi:unnamed protein product [Schistocephalus solidus]|uniref:Reverse transcriptase domain-containing protein n=1 Tax=Schistocephalus solidus TaxID=70667 RepID=A0A183SFX1_SCHSO|nr:unnamed protein product [Schistocephalus solidus]